MYKDVLSIELAFEVARSSKASSNSVPRVDRVDEILARFGDVNHCRANFTEVGRGQFGKSDSILANVELADVDCRGSIHARQEPNGVFIVENLRRLPCEVAVDVRETMMQILDRLGGMHTETWWIQSHNLRT